MPLSPAHHFPCPHCQSTTSWDKPGIAAMMGADILATLVALPFLVFGVVGFVVAIVAVMFALIYWLHQRTHCHSCGKCISVAQARDGGGA